MRVRNASIVWGGAAVVAVLLGSVAAVPVATAADTTRARRDVPDAPTIPVATTSDAETLAAELVAEARTGGTVPKVPVDHTSYRYLFLNDVNGYGTAVGYAMTSAYKGAARDLVLGNGTSSEVIGLATLDEPIGERSAFAQAINDDGIVTGVAPCQCRRTEPGVPASVAFRWSRADGFSYAPMPAGVNASIGVDINDEGVILINSWASPSPSDDGAWLWDPNVGTLEKLPDFSVGGASGASINNDGTVVGTALVGGVGHAVRWGWGRQHRIRDLAPGPLESHATDINEDGTIVGWQGTHAMAWLGNGRRARDLGEGQALAINDDDQVAGNIVLATIVPADGGTARRPMIAAVYDLWEPAHRVVLDADRLLDIEPTRLNADGFVVNWQSMWGPAVLP
jgi:hypothetical protein